MNLYDRMEKACQGKSENCTVNLGELVTDFDWDRVAFIKMQAWAKDPAALIEVDQLAMDEFEDLIVFANDRQVMRVLKRDYDPETPFDQTIFLDFGAEKALWKVFPKAEAVFEVHRLTEGALHNIDLVPAQR